MPKLCIGFGNNICGNIDARNTAPTIDRPTRVCRDLEVQQILWASWSCTIAQDAHGKTHIWGSDALISTDTKEAVLDISTPPLKVVGLDTPIGYIDHNRFLVSFSGKRSAWEYDDLAIRYNGAVALLNQRILIFENLESVFEPGCTAMHVIEHPLLRNDGVSSLHGTESKTFVYIDGTASHLAELVWDPKAPAAAPVLRVLEELEGLGISSIVTGAANRLGVITTAGEAYLVNSRSTRAERLDIGLDEDEEVRHLGLGSNFEIIVTNLRTMVRGKNDFGQLGMTGPSINEFRQLEGVGTSVSQVMCARWSTLVLLDQ